MPVPGTGRDWVTIQFFVSGTLGNTQPPAPQGHLWGWPDLIRPNPRHGPKISMPQVTWQVVGNSRDLMWRYRKVWQVPNLPGAWNDLSIPQWIMGRNCFEARKLGVHILARQPWPESWRGQEPSLELLNHVESTYQMHGTSKRTLGMFQCADCNFYSVRASSSSLKNSGMLRRS